ncbi:GH-E family nuclease [Ralstonia solanacearum]|uniref:GH-E family nuclease n=1 Tax=Ralstonia solanacearum TaxID=305 RepID=UPI0009E74934|nr:GH-E family nuclease [Ralstonia solanacearum]
MAGLLRCGRSRRVAVITATVAPGQGRRDWDIDHQPPWSQRDLTGMTRSQVLDEYNKGTRLECPSCNRSRGAKPAEQ